MKYATTNKRPDGENTVLADCRVEKKHRRKLCGHYLLGGKCSHNWPTIVIFSRYQRWRNAQFCIQNFNSFPGAKLPTSAFQLPACRTVPTSLHHHRDLCLDVFSKFTTIGIKSNVMVRASYIHTVSRMCYSYWRQTNFRHGVYVNFITA